MKATLDDGVNMANYVTNVMNFYEYHLETLKNMVVKQNETILNQKGQIETYEHDLSVYKHKVTDLEDKLRGITANFIEKSNPHSYVVFRASFH